MLLTPSDYDIDAFLDRPVPSRLAWRALSDAGIDELCDRIRKVYEIEVSSARRRKLKDMVYSRRVAFAARHLNSLSAAPLDQQRLTDFEAIVTATAKRRSILDQGLRIAGVIREEARSNWLPIYYRPELARRYFVASGSRFTQLATAIGEDVGQLGTRYLGQSLAALLPPALKARDTSDVADVARRAVSLLRERGQVPRAIVMEQRSDSVRALFGLPPWELEPPHAPAGAVGIWEGLPVFSEGMA